MKTEVRIDNAHQRHTREMQPFGDHLGADEDVDLTGPELVQDMTVILLALKDVRVHSLDPGFRKHPLENQLHPLRANARV